MYGYAAELFSLNIRPFQQKTAPGDHAAKTLCQKLVSIQSCKAIDAVINVTCIVLCRLAICINRTTLDVMQSCSDSCKASGGISHSSPFDWLLMFVLSLGCALALYGVCIRHIA